MTDIKNMTIVALARAYRNKTLSPVEVTKEYLAKINPGNIYRVVSEERALAQAKKAEKLFSKNTVLGPLQGVPIALKDLIDTRDEVTAAGSKVLAKGAKAKQDAPVAARLDAAGAVFLGKTNMTELAFSGLGINPHFGTPGNALNEELIPGGSSSGSAVAVAKDLAVAAIGSDTGGSVRIPSAFNAIVGLKTTNGLIPTDGVVPLSTTLDTIGPMTKTVEDAWHLYRTLAAKAVKEFDYRAKNYKLLVPSNVVFDSADTLVIESFDKAIKLFSKAGHKIEYKNIAEFDEILSLYRQYGSFAAHESLAIYENMLTTDGENVDPRVSTRILQFKNRTASEYLRLSYKRKEILNEFWQKYRSYNAILSPTVAILPPKTEALESSDEAYFRANGLILRNTLLFNFLGGPALSVPIEKGSPVGLMIAAAPFQERAVLSVAKFYEQAS